MKKYLGVLIPTVMVFSLSCVKSNLDNVFDPTTIPGLFIGLSLPGGGGGDTSSAGTTGSSGGTASSSCTSVVPTVLQFTTVGTTNYVVPSDASNVWISVIGGGGAGGIICSSPQTPVLAGGTSVKTMGAGSNLVEASGGSHGSCSDTTTQGLGGTGGLPSGITGSNGNYADASEASGGVISAGFPFYGNGGKGSVAPNGIFPDAWGGGGGGSGGKTDATFSDLAGQTLEITVGNAGSWSINFEHDGIQGYVQIVIY